MENQKSNEGRQREEIKLAFFGLYSSFGHDRIGGTNSLVRRLSMELVSHWDMQVDYVLYGSGREEEITIFPGIRARYYGTLHEALKALSDYDHIITIYLPPGDLLTYTYFRVFHRKQISFHMLYQSWSDSIFIRLLMFLPDRLIHFNGRSFAVSPRLMHYVKQWDQKAVLLWPPVPSNYFIPLSEKNFLNQIRVTFLGRIDPRKGVIETIKIFNALAKCPDVKLAFYGIYWEDDPIATQLHYQLLEQSNFTYVPVKWKDYSIEIDDMVRSALHDTDIFIQPYRKLSSTIDLPLLILEAMASLCAVITKPYGDIPNVYGTSLCLLDGPDMHEQAVKRILSAKDWLKSERERIDRQNKILYFDTNSVAKKFVKALDLPSIGEKL